MSHYTPPARAVKLRADLQAMIRDAFRDDLGCEDVIKAFRHAWYLVIEPERTAGPEYKCSTSFDEVKRLAALGIKP